jgi:hypothetical protein
VLAEGRLATIVTVKIIILGVGPEAKVILLTQALSMVMALGMGGLLIILVVVTVAAVVAAEVVPYLVVLPTQRAVVVLAVILAVVVLVIKVIHLLVAGVVRAVPVVVAVLLGLKNPAVVVVLGYLGKGPAVHMEPILVADFLLTLPVAVAVRAGNGVAMDMDTQVFHKVLVVLGAEAEAVRQVVVALPALPVLPEQYVFYGRGKQEVSHQRAFPPHKGVFI